MATGLVAVVALPAAQAQTSHNLDSETVSNVPASTAVAAANVVLDFSRSEISSKAAPAKTEPSSDQKASAASADAAEPAADKPRAKEQPAEKPETEAPAETGQPVTGLAGPLAQMNISSPFGYRTNPLTGASGEFHNGTDFSSGCETPVLASAAGTVVEASSSAAGYGNRVVVDHGGGLKTTYNHLGSIAVQAGQEVAAGERVAGVGTTGNSTGCHLHFEVLVNEETVDPAGWL
ncbi:M23 family metallopeptidase [Crystallibacter degradans]|uniref:M23 family metallopeptidase n=1 Tax=Crystallibacter degradans TaxID=2726743 RepID=UPI003211F156